MTAVTIRYQTINSKGQITTKEKTFKTEAAMQAWTNKQEATSGSWLGVVAYSR